MKARVVRHQGKRFTIRAARQARRLSEARRRHARRAGRAHVRRRIGYRGCQALSSSAARATATISASPCRRRTRRKWRTCNTFTRELMTRRREAISKRSWTGSPSITGIPTIRTSMSSLRGRADDGKDLVISRDYISRGFRQRAAERVTLELGPRSEQEIRTALEKEVEVGALDQPRPGIARYLRRMRRRRRSETRPGWRRPGAAEPVAGKGRQARTSRPG